jgi:hypothetical protein
MLIIMRTQLHKSMLGGGRHLNAQANRPELDNKPKQANNQFFFLFQLTEADGASVHMQ